MKTTKRLYGANTVLYTSVTVMCPVPFPRLCFLLQCSVKLAACFGFGLVILQSSHGWNFFLLSLPVSASPLREMPLLLLRLSPLPLCSAEPPLPCSAPVPPRFFFLLPLHLPWTVRTHQAHPACQDYSCAISQNYQFCLQFFFLPAFEDTQLVPFFLQALYSSALFRYGL